MSSTATQRRFQEGLIATMGLASDVLDRPGTAVVSQEHRADSGMVVVYQLGAHAIVLHDPALADQLAPLADSSNSLFDDEFRRWAGECGGEIVGQAVMKTLVAPWQAPPHPPGFKAVMFDWSRTDHLALVQGLIDVSDDGDLDDAELAMDELDEVAAGLVGTHGELVAFASMRPWDMGDGFGDIGVMTRAAHRGCGLGRAVVAALIEGRLPDGWEPLYRCDPENAGSHRLSAGLGFVVANSLTAARFGTADPAD